jgi:hypothetical protein
MQRILVVGCLVVGLLGHGWVARANTGGESARILYKAAMAHMAAGEHLRAAVGFDAAYSASNKGILLWNAARAYHRAGALTDARGRYLGCLEAEDLPVHRKELAVMHLVEVEVALRAQGVSSPLVAEVPAIHSANLTGPYALSGPLSPPSRDAADGALRAVAPPSGPRQTVRYASRPLTLPKRTMGLAAGTGVGSGRGEDPQFGIKSAVSFGVSDDMEIGAVALDLLLSPAVIYDRPTFYGLARLRRSANYEVAMKSEIMAGVQQRSAWGLFVGMQALIRSGKIFRMDVGGYMDFIFGDPRVVNLRIPLEFHFQIRDQAFASAYSAFVLPEFDSSSLQIPLGFGLGYTFESNAHPFCDLRALFEWSRLVDLGQDENVDPESFTLSLVARFFFYL